MQAGKHSRGQAAMRTRIRAENACRQSSKNVCREAGKQVGRLGSGQANKKANKQENKDASKQASELERMQVRRDGGTSEEASWPARRRQAFDYARRQAGNQAVKQKLKQLSMLK